MDWSFLLAWWFYAILLGLGTVGVSVYYMLNLNKLPIVNRIVTPKLLALVGVVGLVLSLAGVLGSFGTASMTPSTGEAELTDLIVDTGKLNSSMAAGEVTDDDYYDDNYHVLTFYLQDVDMEDNGNISFEVTAVREVTASAGAVQLVCDFNTRFEYDSVTENLINEDSDGTLEEAYTKIWSGKNVQTFEQKATGWMEFAEGETTDTVIVSMRQEETTQDKMTEKDTLSIDCHAGGKAIEVIFVADN
jgi:hypothetical protein